MLLDVNREPNPKRDAFSEHIEELQRQQALQPLDSRDREIARLIKVRSAKQLLRRFVAAHSLGNEQDVDAG
jgi:hypothetical protein